MIICEELHQKCVQCVQDALPEVCAVCAGCTGFCCCVSISPQLCQKLPALSRQWNRFLVHNHSSLSRKTAGVTPIMVQGPSIPLWKRAVRNGIFINYSLDPAYNVQILALTLQIYVTMILAILLYQFKCIQVNNK